MTNPEKQVLGNLGFTNYPPLGDERKQYTVILSEPEINALYGAVAFIRAACVGTPFQGYWDHYGSALQAVDDKLKAHDDGDAPFEARTNDGLTARLYARDGAEPMPVHGAVLIDGIWYPKQWTAKGWAASDEPGEGDLVDFVPGR